MAKLIVSIDGVVVKDVHLSKERTTLGRRPYNDIVIDNLAVSGEHAVVLLQGEEAWLEDLNSTNGTYINGKPVKKQALATGDAIGIGKYKVKFLSEPGSARPLIAATSTIATAAPKAADAPSSIKIISGAATGRDVPLTKVVTTIGKPGVAVASITRRPRGFVLAHVEGPNKPLLNGEPLGEEPAPLANGDIFELAGTQMQFIEAVAA